MSEIPPAKSNFRNSLGIVVPRAGRRVHTPTALSNTNIRCVSDLIPTSAVTDTYPVCQNLSAVPAVAGTTYGTLIPGNQSDNHAFDDYVLVLMKDEGYREGGWFTRCFFAPPIVTVYPNVAAQPVKTEWETKEMPWEPVLENIRFIPDSTTQVPVQNSAGAVTYEDRIRVEYAYRPGIEAPSWIRTLYYVSTSPFTRGPDLIVPQPSDVSWDIDPLGQSGSFPRCLHKKVSVPGVSSAQGLVNGSVERKFPATNYTTWTDYDFAFDVTYEEPLYIGALKRVYAPPLTPITKIITY